MGKYLWAVLLLVILVNLSLPIMAQPPPAMKALVKGNEIYHGWQINQYQFRTVLGAIVNIEGGEIINLEPSRRGDNIVPYDAPMVPRAPGSTPDNSMEQRPR